MKKTRAKRIRRINFVSVSVILVVVAGAYFGWKFIPVYYQAHKVDTILQGHRRESTEIDKHRTDKTEDRILGEVTEELRELGIEDPRMKVYFAPDYTSLHVDYSVEVRFFFGKSKTLYFERSVEIERDEI